MNNWSFKNVYYLLLLTSSYIIGEIAHFLINTTSREVRDLVQTSSNLTLTLAQVARDVHFGDKECFFNETFTERKEDNNCSDVGDEGDCREREFCYWDYSGLGYEYQILAGPAFIAVFSVCGVLVSVLSDRLGNKISRVLLVGLGTATFSLGCLLMGLADSYWQLVLLRMMIAGGESVCRPMTSALIADLFSPTARGVANGVFSWGVYLGYGLAFLLGIELTKADVMGWSWRASYLLAGLPGLLLSLLVLVTLRNPATVLRSQQVQADGEEGFRQKLWRSFSNPALLLLLAAAIARQTAGFSWAYNTRPFFLKYHPDFSLGYWILLASCLGGSFGVFAGGFFSDRLVTRLGLHSRLWLLAACTIIAAPLATATLYLHPPASMATLVVYYLFSETWFAVLFTVIVEIVEPEVRASCIALFLFCMNQVGGNLPVIITPIKSFLDDYRLSLALIWPGFLCVSALLFLLSSFPLCYLERERQRRLVSQDTKSGQDSAPSLLPASNTESSQPLLAPE